MRVQPENVPGYFKDLMAAAEKQKALYGDRTLRG